ncbi:DUF885 domain-containing protein [bacterium]|nr:DUF885 domain-containing protein [bacterium]
MPDTRTPFEKECAKLEGKYAEKVRLQKLIELTWDYALRESPEFATYVGIQDYDTFWTDRSLDAISRRKKELDAPWKVLKTIRRGTLSSADALNLDLLLRKYELDREGREFPEEYLPISQMWGVHQEIPQTLSLMRHETAADYGRILARMEAIPAALAQVEILLDKGLEAQVTYPQIAMQKALNQIEALAAETEEKSALLQAFREMPANLSGEQKALLKSQAGTLYATAVKPALGRLAEKVKAYAAACRTETAWAAMPEGQKWYAFRAKQSTTTSLTPQEIHDIGLKEVARLTLEMEAAQKKTDYLGLPEGFDAHIRMNPRFYFTSASEMIESYRALCKRIDAQLPRFFLHLPQLPYGVEPVPDYSAPSQPPAYYQPGSLVGARAGMFYANTYDLSARPKWTMEGLAAHEAVPGHHLQIALAQELQGVPEFRKHEMYTAYVEGWGLYAETLGKEMGLYQDPYSEYGRLTYEMWRSIRLVVDTGMHSLGWSREQALEYFRKHTGKSDLETEQEVDRYLVFPGQALAYKIGHLKLLELRAIAQGAEGEKFDIRVFHDKVLRNGALPLDILEKLVTEREKPPAKARNTKRPSRARNG